MWQSHLQAQPDVYKPHAQCWNASLAARQLHWKNQCGAYFQRPRVCAFCGAFRLGSLLAVSHFTYIQPTAQTPPYALSNAFLAQYTVSPTGQWNCCRACNGPSKRNAQHAVFMSPAYQKALLSCTPLQQQFLSVLDCRLDVARRYHGFAHGQYITDSLLDHPLIMWNDAAECCTNRELLTAAVEPLLQILLQSNVIVKKY